MWSLDLGLCRALRGGRDRESLSISEGDEQTGVVHNLILNRRIVRNGFNSYLKFCHWCLCVRFSITHSALGKCLKETQSVHLSLLAILAFHIVVNGKHTPLSMFIGVKGLSIFWGYGSIRDFDSRDDTISYLFQLLSNTQVPIFSVLLIS